MAAIELGCKYVFYAPNGVDYFALNDPTDAHFVGYVTDITGLDSPGVRENAQVVTAGDGGHHGPFWKDRRPWTFAGTIMPQFPLVARDAAQEKMQAVLGQAFRSDGHLIWTPADTIPRWLPFRTQQPTRNPKGSSNAVRDFQIACVSSDWRIFSQAIRSTVVPITADAFPVNLGNTDASPAFRVAGPLTSPIYIKNFNTNKTLQYNGNIAAGDSLLVDLTGQYPDVHLVSTGLSQLGLVDPLQTDWSIAIIPGGANTFTLVGTGYSGATTLTMTWRDAWL